MNESMSGKSVDEEFNGILLRSVNFILRGLGESAEAVIHYRLERNYMKWDSIPVKTEQFSTCLKDIFGKKGEYILKMSIVKILHNEIQEKFVETEDYSLADYANDARKKYLQKRRIALNKPLDYSKFDMLLHDVIDEVLKEIFIAEDVECICGYLRKFDLKPEEIPEKPEVFSEGLKDMMGSIQSIERLIIRRLHSKLQLKFTEKRNYKFSDHIKKLRASSAVEE